jgi:hypothetical protein
MSGQRQRTGEFGFAAKKPIVDELFGITAELNHTRVEFLKIDVETALTFSGIALHSRDDDPKKRRNQLNARKSYDTIVRFVGKIPINEDDRYVIFRKLERLKSELQVLGETF